jgi:hypothetical protein
MINRYRPPPLGTQQHRLALWLVDFRSRKRPDTIVELFRTLIFRSERLRRVSADDHVLFDASPSESGLVSIRWIVR